VLQWAVIGAASHRRTYYAPEVTDFLRLKWTLQARDVPIFFKGNMRCLREACQEWHEDFPIERVAPVTESVQLRLL
jgi:hypothetical protein